MKEKPTRKKNTQEFREDAVKLVPEQGHSSSEAGRCLGIHSNNTFRWIRAFRHDQEDIAQGGVTRRKLEEENGRLGKENTIGQGLIFFWIGVYGS